MLQTPCPRCGKSVLHFTHEDPIHCDAVNCCHSFSLIVGPRSLAPSAAVIHPGSVPPPAPVVAPAIAFERPAPILLTPHRCPRCQESIAQAAGKPHATIDHACGARASLYALLFHTPCCAAYVEMPFAAAGRPQSCPACGRGFYGPKTNILHRTSGDVDSTTVMTWDCPCGQRLQCNTIVDNQPVAGELVVCPCCRNVQVVPSAGRRVTGS